MSERKNLILAGIIELNRELAAIGEHRDLLACGGGALWIMGVVSRETRDLDVILPSLDPVLLKCSIKVAKEIGLNEGWLNNGPSGFVRDLENGFELRAIQIYQGTHLIAKALGRRDLIATKLQGLCDRDEIDLLDLVSLKPWLLDRDASPLWPARVESQLNLLFSRLPNGK
jgi:hypothetical protein